MANPGSTGAVAAAIAGNATVMLAKFVAFLFTGSGAMLSEAIHTYEEFEKFALEFGDDVVELLAKKIDTIERRIRRQVPQAKHMDLEAE